VWIYVQYGVGHATYTVERTECRPGRKVYSITESGMIALKEWLVTPVDNSISS
jgi:DNA-binding PadR family transcriptional regulator